MKKLKLLYLLIFAVSFTLSSCGNDDDASSTPAPLAASFTQDKNFATVNQTVNFTNTSTQATRYEWTFGDGQSSTIANPNVVYTKNGTYTIKLTAYNDANEAITTTSTIVVGNVFLTTAKLVKMSKVDASGTPWDPDGKPDLMFAGTGPFYPPQYFSIVPSGANMNVDLDNLPFTWDYTQSSTTYLFPGNFRFFVYEESGGRSTVGDWNLNNFNFADKVDPKTGIGKHTLTNGNLIELELNFHIK